MINILTNLTAIAAAATPVFITNGIQVIDTASAECEPSQPMQIFMQGNPAAQLYNLVLANPANGLMEFQIQSNNCAGFSLSYPGETTGAGPLRAQAVIQLDSQVFFTISPAVPGETGSPFNIIYQSTLEPLYLTGWSPNLTFSNTGPLTFERENAGDLRQQWQFVWLKLLGIAN
ncbi:hypothetical protein BDP27DRAFT_1366922 [Rhodocollybia butyracea]|uniref:Uncharacterized protein n=1 Tax=Rhodocollybia butyracea TaxID=206335 RepID=A0A9P5U3P1_9AGAR|nr:hypothetical protein BDP27DRAFT_1366922 [Rhodocollybia butyracea]